jgi:hypothetical protein
LPLVEPLEARTLLDGTFTQLPIAGSQAPVAGVGTMLLMTDGTVMVQGGGQENGGPGGVTDEWYRLTPSATGSYLNGTWSQLKNMNYERIDYASEVLPSGDLLVQGGEASNDTINNPTGDNTPSGEIYDPYNNTWTNITTFYPYGAFYPNSTQPLPDNFGDDPSELLPNGTIIAGYIFGPYTYIYSPQYDPATGVPEAGTWAETGMKLYPAPAPNQPLQEASDEETWVMLPGGDVLSYDVFTPPVNGMWQAQYYTPGLGTWQATGGIPVPLSQASFTFPDQKTATDWELGPAFLLPDGRVYQLGANGNTAFYSPSTNTWTAGPVIPESLVCDDAPGAELPDGNILFAADTALYEGPTHIIEFNPTTNTYTDLSSELPTSFLNGGFDPTRVLGSTGESGFYNFPSFAYRMLLLPTGQVMIGNTFNQEVFVYTEQGGSVPASSVPTISSISAIGNGSYLLTGTGLNGVSEGSGYGDDAEMASNYPIVRLTDPGGNVSYARTYNWTPGVATGTKLVTTDFTVPAGLLANTYMVSVIANGVASSPMSLTLDPAPTIATPATAVPNPVTGTTANLSVLGADNLGESTLTYTWTATTIPSGAAAPTFAVNGTNAARNDTVIFHAAGTYTFQVTFTNRAGLSNSSSVTVVVAQTVTAITLSPGRVSVNRNAAQQLSATAFDQFGASFTSQPAFAWTVTAGGGHVSAGGLYTAPGSGTLATVAAAVGPVVATAAVYVLSSPWATQDVGSAPVSGAAGDNGSGTFVVIGSGSGIGGTADAFRFADQTLSDDDTITAHFDGQQSTGSSGLTGLMIRNDLTAGAAMAFLGILAGGGTVFADRTSASDSASTVGGSGTPSWLRLVRAGTTLTGYESNDGASWTQAGSATVAMGATVEVGMGSAGGSSGALDTATFDQVSIDTTPTVVTAAAAAPSPATGTTASLSVLGNDVAGESTLTYTWVATTVPSGAPAPAFASNGTNAARNDTVTFQRAGSYGFTVKITNGVGLSATSRVSLTVNQTITDISVAPATAALVEGASQSFTATAFDQFGQELASQPTFTWSVSGGGVGGTVSPAGLYTTPGLGVGSDTVRAASGSVSGTATVSVTVEPAVQLVVTPQSEPPASVTAGVGFGVVVRAEDPFGNVDPSFAGNVTLALAGGPSGSTLGGTLNEAASAGVASFTGLTLNRAGSGATLMASAGSLTPVTTTAITVTAAPATRLVVTTGPPGSVTAGAGFGLVVAAEDGFGNIDPSFGGSVTVALGNNPAGGMIAGTLSVPAGAGVATFAGLSLNQAATGDTLKLTSGGLNGATTNAFAVTAGTATQLVVTAPAPTSATAGTGFGLEVSAEDGFGNVDPTFSSVVTLALASGPAGAILGGVPTATAAAGVARFSGLTLDTAASDVTLSVSSGSLAPATASLAVKAAPATHLVITNEPPSHVTAGAGFGLVVAAEDSFGNVDPTFQGTVALANSAAGVALGGTLSLTPSAGVASFAGLTLDAAGTNNTIGASASGLSGVSTVSISVSAAPATQLVVTAQPPASVNAGTLFGLVVAAEDSFGNVDPTFSGSVTAALANNPGSATLGGAVTVPANAGVATFSGLVLNRFAIGDTLSLSSTGVGPATTSPFNVIAGPATRLVVTAQPPGSITAGHGFGLAVAAEDPFGNVDPNFVGTVTIALMNHPAGAVLGGSLHVTARAGVATFAGLTLDQAAVGDTLQATSGGLSGATTSPLTVKAAPAVQLVVTAEPPSSVAAGSPFGLAVAAEDGFGNVDPTYGGMVTIDLPNNAGGTGLAGTLSITASSGVATFAGLMLDQAAGSDTLLAASGSLNAVTTSPIAVSPGTASLLVITLQPPASVAAGAGFSLGVAAEDAFGNVDPRYNGTVTISLANDPGGATLRGTQTMTASGGTATFAGLNLNKAGADATLEASGSGLSSATSSAIEVTAAPATQLVVTAEPPASVTAGSGFGLVVAAEDAYGNVDPSYSGNVMLILANHPPGATLGGESSVAASAGVATFAGLTLDQAAAGETLVVSSGSLPTAATTTIAVPAAPATRLEVTVQPPSRVTAGSVFGLVVSAEDAFGNIDPTYGGSVTLDLAGTNHSPGATLGGTTVVTARGGVATFAGLTLDLAAPGDILQASGGTLGGAMTSAIAVAAAPASQLVVTAQPPSSITAGGGFGLAVTAEDGFGNIDPTFDGTVTLDLGNNPAAATLGGLLAVSANAGVATFGGLMLNRAGPGVVVQASSSSLSVSTQAITVLAGAAAQLVITTEPPASVTAGSGFGLIVAAEDALGNVDPTYGGTVSLASATGSAPLGGTTPATASGGVASFAGLMLDQAAAGEMLVVSSGSLPPAATTPIAVLAAPATHLVITTEPPAGVTAGQEFGLVVAAEDPFGNVDPTYDGGVSLASSPHGGPLGGIPSVTASSGMASFADLMFDQAATGATLVASSGSLKSATTTAIAVAAGLATHLVITTEPPVSVTAGSPFGLVASAEDDFGNVDPTFAGKVTLALADNPGGAVLGGTATAPAIGGVAAFSDPILDRAAVGDSLQASSGPLKDATTSEFQVVAAPATHWVVTSEPAASITAGSGFGLVASAEDEFGNVDPSFQGDVTVALVSNPGGDVLGGTSSTSAAAGVAEFSGLTLARAASAETLGVFGGGLSAATTGEVTVATAAATHLVIAVEPPGSVTAGSPFGLVVLAEDDFGNVDPRFSGPAALSLSGNPGGATLGGATTATAHGGVAMYSGLTLNRAGAGNILAVSAGGLSSISTSPVTVVAAPATHLVVVAQPPGSVNAGSPFGLAVVAEDGFGNIDPSFTGGVTLALANNPGGATLGGGLTVMASGGTATFSGLTLDRGGSGYTLQVTSSGLTGTLSSGFGVISPPVRVVSVAVQNEKMGKHKSVNLIVVQFNGALNAGSAENLSAYTLTTVAMGKKHPSKPVALTQSSYDANSETVALIPRKALVLSPPLQLQIKTSALSDAQGRPVAGNSAGAVVASLSKGGISVD